MKLSHAIEAKKLDLRLREKLIHEGKLKKDDLGKYLQNLEDDADNLTYTENEKSSTSNASNEDGNDVKTEDLSNSENSTVGNTDNNSSF